MKIGDYLYFSPRFRFRDLDLADRKTTVEALRDRVAGYYLAPAEQLCRDGHVFTSGLATSAAIDFLAVYGGGAKDEVSVRFSRWLMENIKEFDAPNPDVASKRKTLAARFYDDFRNGLVHEGRVKNCGQFVTGQHSVVMVVAGVMMVDAGELLEATRRAFERWCELVAKDEGVWKSLSTTLSTHFDAEIAAARS